MMKKLYIPLILISISALSAPASAACTPEISKSSTLRSCESGVTVYRGQINGPDFRLVELQQKRKLAETRARVAEARAQAAARVKPQAVQPSVAPAPVQFARGGFVLTPFAQTNGQGFGNRGGFNFGGGLNPAGFAGRNIPVRTGVGTPPPQITALGVRGFGGGFRGRVGGRGFSGGRR